MVAENGKNRAEALASVAKGNETVEWACSMPQLMQASATPAAVALCARAEHARGETCKKEPTTLEEHISSRVSADVSRGLCKITHMKGSELSSPGDWN